MIRSPLNYTGGKFKLLPQIIPLFPENIGSFYDLFCGGGNVGINIEADKIVFNDTLPYLIDLFELFKREDFSTIDTAIKKNIIHYKLDKSNQEGYLELRKNYNKDKKPLDFFTLICYAFNHQIRFNANQEFNIPFGKERSSYNEKIETNLKNFIETIKSKNVSFENKDYADFFSNFQENDFIYCDPPYLITTASYNDGKRGFKGWNEDEEKRLLEFLDKCNEKNIKFALSNVLFMGDKTNDILLKWSENYTVYNLDHSYKNSNYQKKETNSQEVLIVNYKR